MHRRFTLIAGILGFTGVLLGAFGAHSLRDVLLRHETTEIWRTAVLYHLLHAVAVLAVTFKSTRSKQLNAAMTCWTLGVVLFSGSLYALAVGGPAKVLGPITPLGGLAFLAGWTLIMADVWAAQKSESTEP
ncbi:MAG TPA: DUF423 domain-containing protein [Opitutaceae bacterium]|nr:DUF423 domain-containing protein [Opitutaceae bacterium]